MTAKLNTLTQIFYEEQKFNYCLVPLLHAFSYYVFQHSKILRGERLHLVAPFLLRVADSTAQGISDQGKDRFPKLRLLRSSHIRAQFCQYTWLFQQNQGVKSQTKKTPNSLCINQPWRKPRTSICILPERSFCLFLLNWGAKSTWQLKKKCFFIISKKVEKKIWYLGFSLLYIIHWFLLLLFKC